jgi:ABC-2 type transport system ATP-binding protein
MSAVIEARGLRKSYGKTAALDGVDLSVPRGRIVGLVGPNGAGKTTALKAILGLTNFEGELKVLGLDPFRQRGELMQRVCFIADTAVLPRWMRVDELIDYVQNVHPRFDVQACRRFLSHTKIAGRSKVKALSKGMVVQLHLAIVLSIDAELLVLDEPTLGLDILFRKRFYEQLLGDYFDANRTIVITTHQIEEVESLLTDLVFIRDGRIVLDASMDAVAQRFVEVEVEPRQTEAARALGPLHERKVLGRTVMLFDGIDPAQLARFGPQHPVSVADLFVAMMGGLNAVGLAA